VPDLPNRTDEETALAGQLNRLFSRYRGMAVSRLGDPPSMENIPAYFWVEIANEIARIIQPTIERVHRESAARFDKLFSLTGQREQHEALADVYSNQRAYALGDDLARRIRESLGMAIADSNRDWAVFLGLLGVIFGAERAERLAVTELTGAVSAGELTQRNRVQAALNSGTLRLPKAVLKRSGVPVAASGDGASLNAVRLVIVAYWVVETDLSQKPDGKVCPLCYPLHEQPESVWSRYYPQGPGPGGPHPRCRCRLRYELEMEADGV